MELEEQSKTATEKARATGELKKQVVPPDLLEEVFELNMQLEELRVNKKMGEDDPALVKDLEAHKAAVGEEVRSAGRGVEELLGRVGPARSSVKATSSAAPRWTAWSIC